MVERTQHAVSLLWGDVGLMWYGWLLKVYGEAGVYIYACLGVVPWGVELVFGEVVAVGVSPLEVAIDAAIRFVASVE